MKKSFDNIFDLITAVILIVIAAWFIMSAIFEDITVDSMLARFAVALACIANLFSKHKKTKILFFIFAFILICIATSIYIYKSK
jgi:hypothetical protein